MTSDLYLVAFMSMLGLGIVINLFGAKHYILNVIGVFVILGSGYFVQKYAIAVAGDMIGVEGWVVHNLGFIFAGAVLAGVGISFLKPFRSRRGKRVDKETVNDSK